MPPVISVEHLSKAYRLGQIGTGTFARDLEVWWAKLRGKPNPLLKIGQEDHGNRDGEIIWALKDVSFTVEQGEVLGIIGRNGAGKSTLLKILSRITAPTEGRVRVKGRIASLLEVGTGFHPELTGRENIYLNGAILGMTRREIARKFDEIVAFAGIEPFIDTPVKRYSSGMYVRLAFAVAAHLDAEILLVDEVLAVGDAEFQKKCLGKMGEVASQEGRTVLFVSHNMGAVQYLCNKSAILTNGILLALGFTENIVREYLILCQEKERNKSDLNEFRPSWAKPFINAVRVKNQNGQEVSTFEMGEPILVEMEFCSPRKIKQPVMGVVVQHELKGVVGGVNTRMTGDLFEERNEGTFTCKFSAPLLPGKYSIDVWLGDSSEDIDTVAGYAKFTIENSDIYKSGKLPFSHMGLIYFLPEWSLK